MIQRTRSSKTLLVMGIAILLVLNFCTLIAAYPQTYTPTSGINASGSVLAKDFSAYYIGAWRLWNNPAHIYNFGKLNDGEPAILPHPEEYKYLPSFLLITSPLLSLNYQQALIVFDIVQFMLLPVMAYIIYKLLENKQLAVTYAVMIIALLLPFPSPNWGFSLSYYWQWGEGQAKVFVAFLLLLSFYFGKKGKPILSGIALAFGFFDPRFGLLALPLFLMYNRKSLKTAAASLIGSLVVSNLMLLYPGMASNFLNMVFSSALTTPLYYYAYIPFFTLIALIIVDFKELVAAFGYKRISASVADTSVPKNSNQTKRIQTWNLNNWQVR